MPEHRHHLDRINSKYRSATVVITGWALDIKGQGMSEIWIETDHTIYQAKFIERVDVHPELELDKGDSSNIGFEIELPLPRRSCKTFLYFRDKSGKAFKAQTITLGPSRLNRLIQFISDDSMVRLENASPNQTLMDFRFHWDFPASKRIIITNKPIVLSGWIYGQGREVAKCFKAYLGNREVLDWRNIPRSDVFEHSPDDNKAPLNSGFDIRFKTGKGLKRIRLVAEFSDGSKIHLGHRLFWVRKPGRIASMFGKLRTQRIQAARNSKLRAEYNQSLKQTLHKTDTHSQAIDVIIPIYRGLEETKQCLESIYRSRSANRKNFEIIAIDDCSPEPELSTYLETEAREGKICLLQNESNRGFVGTVNRGMTLHRKRDCILLNSDTEVFGNWLDRIIACATSNAKIATITPFSNNATLCSYPAMGVDNNIPSGFSPEKLDQLFANKNQLIYHDVPTGVGFCMYVRRRTLDQIGFFDEEAFGKGYGEENDFCRRAVFAGWRNVHLCDTFVYHKGAISFVDASKPRILEAITTINRLHPGYDSLIQKFFDEDPAREERAKIDIERVNASIQPRILFISHNRGGGTQKHIVEITSKLKDVATFFLLNTDPNKTGQYQLLHLPDQVPITPLASQFNYDAVVNFCRRSNITRVHYHNLVDQDTELMHLAHNLSIPYDVTIHDYFLICPQITLTPGKTNYCNLPTIDICESCLKKHPVKGIKSVSSFRSLHSQFLKDAERVITPSDWTMNAIKRFFPDSPLMRAYHPEADPDPEPRPTPPQSDMLTIGVLGALSREKGADVLEAVTRDAKKRDLPIRYILFGFAYRQLEGDGGHHLRSIGKYHASELDNLLKEVKPDLFWFPAQWPETYSYTLSECMSRGLPIVAPDIGAFPERLSKRPNSWIVKWDTSPAEINDLLLNLKLEKDTPCYIHSDTSSSFYESEYLSWSRSKSSRLTQAS